MKYKVYLIIILLGFVTLLLSCVQETHPKTLTFRVDMTDAGDVQGVDLRGNLKPLSWEKGLPMNDANGDGIYEVQFELNTASDYLQFKFVKNDSLFELEGDANRKLKFEYQPETLSYQGVFDKNESN